MTCREEQNWIAQKLEQPDSISDQDKQQILEDLVVSDAFEQFLANKFPKNKVVAYMLIPETSLLISTVKRMSLPFYMLSYKIEG